jgi:hypothetical protein
MPREGEPSRKAKEALKIWCKTKIVTPAHVESAHRPTARLSWSCDVEECGKFYTSYRSMIRHKREAHEPPTHRCACGTIFKRLEYLIMHEQKCLKKVAATQTDPIADQSAGTQTNFTMTNSVTNYLDILKVFSPKSKEVIFEPEELKGGYFGVRNPEYLSDSSSDESNSEEDYNRAICARKRTMPALPCPTGKKAKGTPMATPSPGDNINLAEDLALSSSSDSSIDEIADIIEKNIM